MASCSDTTCPGCGGKASYHTDDGVTYCENNGPTGCHAKNKGDNLAGMHVEINAWDNPPPNYRGGK